MSKHQITMVSLDELIYLEDKIKKQENTIQELTAKADNATQQVQSIACRALDTSGQRFVSLATNKQEKRANHV